VPSFSSRSRSPTRIPKIDKEGDHQVDEFSFMGISGWAELGKVGVLTFQPPLQTFLVLTKFSKKVNKSVF
jgi:hypothetical protein